MHANKRQANSFFMVSSFLYIDYINFDVFCCSWVREESDINSQLAISENIWELPLACITRETKHDKHMQTDHPNRYTLCVAADARR